MMQFGGAKQPEVVNVSHACTAVSSVVTMQQPYPPRRALHRWLHRRRTAGRETASTRIGTSRLQNLVQLLQLKGLRGWSLEFRASLWLEV